MKIPNVSIVVPIYNVEEKYLTKCIESLQNQSLKEIEIILVDDGSTNDAGRVCDAYAQKDGRIHVIHKKNGGLSSARNAGFFTAIGKWVTFVDGDDWVEPAMCSELYRIGEEKNVQLVMCSKIEEHAYGKNELPSLLEHNKVYCGAECRALQAEVLNFKSNISTSWSKLLNRKLLLEHHIVHDEGLKQGAEDIEFNIRLFDQLERVIYIDKPFYHYVCHELSITNSFDESNLYYTVECFKKIGAYLEEMENRKQFMPVFYNRLLYVIITAAISGYFNPRNKEAYCVKKKKYKKYLQEPLMQEALKKAPKKGLSIQRKIILVIIQCQWFFALNCLGKLKRI